MDIWKCKPAWGLIQPGVVSMEISRLNIQMEDVLSEGCLAVFYRDIYSGDMCSCQTEPIIAMTRSIIWFAAMLLKIKIL